jgi:hypothetical protein
MKKLLLLLLSLLSSHFAMAQTPVRVFTYDAAGNRIAMGIPVSQAPRKTDDSVEEKMADMVSFTAHPDGHVQIHVLKGSGETAYYARVYTTSGQIVAKLQTTTSPVSSINLSSYPPGVYIVEVIIGERHITHKIIRE